jgi:hypothetical protein
MICQCHPQFTEIFRFIRFPSWHLPANPPLTSSHSSSQVQPPRRISILNSDCDYLDLWSSSLVNHSKKFLASTNGINWSPDFELNTAIAISDQLWYENISTPKSFLCVSPEIDAYHGSPSSHWEFHDFGCYRTVHYSGTRFSSVLRSSGWSIEMANTTDCPTGLRNCSFSLCCPSANHDLSNLSFSISHGPELNINQWRSAQSVSLRD